MTDVQLSSLDLHSLSKRLRDLAGEERSLQADFLLHLDALDRRRGYVELGYPSLWEYCLRALHLREGAAGRRIGAMRVIRRFPPLVEAVRDGRLCLSTLCVLGPVLTPENVEELTTRAAFKTKAEVDALAVSVRPRSAPADGLRRLAAQRAGGVAQVPQPPRGELPLPLVAARAEETDPRGPRVLELSQDLRAELPVSDDASRQSARPLEGHEAGAARHDDRAADAERLSAPSPDPAQTRRDSPPELRPVSEAQWSLRVTLDAEARRALDTLTELLAHKVPDGNLAAVLKEALRCGIERHAVRRGAAAPARARKVTPALDDTRGKASAPPSEGGDRVLAPPAHAAASLAGSPGARPSIPASVRRQVWARDAGRCTFEAPDGTRCESRWKLELDHVVPWALGGSTTIDNLRLRCRAHNLLHAERVFGREHMARFRCGSDRAPAGYAPGT